METFQSEGYCLVNGFYSGEEVAALVHQIESPQEHSDNFRKSGDLFAIRQFFKEIPAVKELVFTPALKSFIIQHFGENYFVVKSIYFDKPKQSNWFVAWHQDLTISVDQKVELESFGPWTVKHNQFAVQPPCEILENIVTIRIHLDDTTESNGALKVIPGSHQYGVVRGTEMKFEEEKSMTCQVDRGGIMLMRPLLFHSSGRTTNAQQRRVIHIELCPLGLPAPLQWAEKESIF